MGRKPRFFMGWKHHENRIKPLQRLHSEFLLRRAPVSSDWYIYWYLSNMQNIYEHTSRQHTYSTQGLASFSHGSDQGRHSCFRIPWASCAQQQRRYISSKFQVGPPGSMDQNPAILGFRISEASSGCFMSSCFTYKITADPIPKEQTWTFLSISCGHFWLLP